MPQEIKAVILTISDSAAAGARVDESGPAVATLLEGSGAKVLGIEIVPDERELIASRLRHYCDTSESNLVVTTGGTGFAPRDVTPEATKDVIERDAPGLAELMRSESFRITPLAALSRSVCGIRRRTLIINLPGSVRGARENLTAILRLLPHAVDLLSQRIES